MKKLLLILTALCLISSPILAKSKKADSEQFSCDDGKRVCRDMDSCADAKFHLRECGMHKLDRDRDGVPCESICG
ncbi:excalibur calcium-binding domain-containing protein [Aggregatibacter actinomycetemcomitans]|uniref:excalibur calcium-binding domain-containing protein n=1 Tax=Aggregatibacter actinomycetemcomitans TaxID=714 RepID=UPI00197BC11F|nr:excalibur calcium-binding domain-containing protein [Aggregatibacter actinomycetemcomitans]MBN6064209.1 excalibur calcium-binding domain-containing protein [Aggregatibacter actinomycetemcomitans]MBN6081285.1 excalibur calcium-binding domain-containing protein [Aggregatibacter actinomycetemcomitans]MBN6084052.1 excalibur calcium-binding domain-containing protein [Aggregatibacter actinomycetemcomitans]